jgi:hypothetical protein
MRLAFARIAGAGGFARGGRGARCGDLFATAQRPASSSALRSAVAVHAWPGSFPCIPRPSWPAVSAQDLAVGPDAGVAGGTDAARAALRVAGAGGRLGVLGVAPAQAALGPGEQVVLAVCPLPVVRAGLAGARAVGGADLLPARPGPHGVIEHLRVPVVAGQHLADGHVLQALAALSGSRAAASWWPVLAGSNSPRSRRIFAAVAPRSRSLSSAYRSRAAARSAR